MNKWFYAYLLGLLIFSSLITPAVQASWSGNIEDKALLACIIKDYNANTTAADVTRIKCHSKGITTLNGLEQFKNLTYLSLFNNKLSTANIASLSNLTFLNIAKNRLEQLNVAGLSQLETLYAFQNKLTSIDLSALPSVTKLRLMQNQLDTLDITELTALESAHLFDNQLEHLSIEGLQKLTFLDVKQNPMPDELYDFFDQQNGIVISHDGNADDWK